MRNVKAGVEAGDLSPRGFPPPSPHEEFCRHFFRCFFCHIGDRYTEDHFCETGRELIVAMLDEVWDSSASRGVDPSQVKK